MKNNEEIIDFDPNEKIYILISWWGHCCECGRDICVTDKLTKIEGEHKVKELRSSNIKARLFVAVKEK